jgi:phage terminase large subunit GpA-like protein
MKPSVVDVNARGKVIKRGLKLWRICTDTAKDLLHGMLQVKTPGPGFVHLNRHLPPEWFAQLVAERRVPVRTVRGREMRWECPAGHRNEALDCAVGALFLIEVLGLDKQTEATWRKWEAGLAPDLFSLPDADGATPSPATSAMPASTMRTAAPVPVEPLPPQAKPVARPTPKPAATLASDEWSRIL